MHAQNNLTWNSHSGSFNVRCLGIRESRPGTPYRYIIMLALPLKFPKTVPAKALKIAVVDNPPVVWRPCPGNPANIRINLLLSILLTRKTKKTWKIKIGLNLPQGRSIKVECQGVKRSRTSDVESDRKLASCAGGSGADCKLALDHC